MKLKYPLTSICAADNEDLGRILQDPDFCEDRYIEFKAQFYKGNSSAIELRKDFSSFANNEGGLIFFGVDDRKNICGIDYLPEIRREISQKLYQLGINWDIVNSISLTSGKFVYIAQIYEVNLYWEKPIIVDGSVWCRENGACTLVNNISKYFSYDRFLPSDIKYLEHLLINESETLERIQYGLQVLPFYYVRIFMELDIFLKYAFERMISDQDKQKAKELLSKFQKFSRNLITQQQDVYLIQKSFPTPKVNENSFRNDLQEIIKDFKDLFHYE